MEVIDIEDLLEDGTENATGSLSMKRQLTAEDVLHFYPRPVMAFGYCHRLRLSVCV